MAKDLSHRLPGPLIHIEGDKFWAFYVKGKQDEPTKKRFALMMRSITAATIPFVRGGYNVLVDFSFPPHYLETLKKQHQKTETMASLHYIILRPSLEICKSRAAGREDLPITNYDRLLDFYRLFEELPDKTISDDEAEPAVLAERVLQGIKDGTFLVS